LRWLKGEDIFRDVAYERMDEATEAHNQQHHRDTRRRRLGKEMA
jgi:hypothetical protein